ncbi:MAG: hypothetical protein H7Y00_08670, partial [Fimbriimonadaceae bacterium]|nr:hypothetical protein [Chitinophagales bacterium]
VFCRIPFYGDHLTIISHPANLFYDNNFSNLIIPDDFNTGHPPLIPALFAAVWKIFGRSLPVSHCITFIAYILLFYSFIKFCSRFIQSKYLYIPTILFLFHPALLAQTIAMSADIFLLLFFFWGLNAIYDKNKISFVIACMLLLLASLRGGIFVFVLFFVDLLIHKKYSFKKIISICMLVFISSIPFVLWNIYHYMQAGWCIVNPQSPWLPHRQFVDGMALLQNIFIFFFRQMEFGFIFIWVIVCIYYLQKNEQAKQLYKIIFISLIFCALFFLPFKNPIVNRYLLFIGMIAFIPASLYLSEITSQTRKILLLTAIAIVFLSTHFYVYPEKMNKAIGYNWDATLANVAYSNLREDVLEQIENMYKPSGEPKKIGTGFPMYQSYYDSNLENKFSVAVVKLETDQLASFDLIIYSNIMNEVPYEIQKEIQNKWKLIYENKTGNIYMQLFANPHTLDSALVHL